MDDLAKELTAAAIDAQEQADGAGDGDDDDDDDDDSVDLS